MKEIFISAKAKIYSKTFEDPKPGNLEDPWRFISILKIFKDPLMIFSRGVLSLLNNFIRCLPSEASCFLLQRKLKWVTLALKQHLSSGTPLARHCGYGSKSVAACPTRQSCFVRKDKNTSFTVASGVVVGVPGWGREEGRCSWWGVGVREVYYIVSWVWWLESESYCCTYLTRKASLFLLLSDLIESSAFLSIFKESSSCWNPWRENNQF